MVCGTARYCFLDRRGLTLAEGAGCLLHFDEGCLFFEVDAAGDDEAFSVVEDGIGLLETRTRIVFETAYGVTVAHLIITNYYEYY